ncbi:MAG: hypothetical protein ACI4V3_10525 [Faecousia sp.]
MLKHQNQSESKIETELSTSGSQRLRMDKPAQDALLRKPRSKKYMELIHKLDAGGHVQNKAQVEALICALREELPEVSLSELKGFVSQCFLGAPYEVHILNIEGQILEHYPAGAPLPDGMEKIRAIAMRGGYEVIEVYTDCYRAIGRNGLVSVIPL